MRRQRQEAGEGAQQIQVSGDLVIHQGVDEARASEIAREVARAELERFSAEADEIGSRRVSDFHERLVAEFSSKGNLGAFADPAFQVLLRKAQLGAASTDRESDFDLLVGLLDDRVKRGNDRHIRAGLDQAVQVVDHIDDSALLGLTVLQAAQQFSPVAGTLDRVLDIMEELFTQLMTAPLPEGMPWLDHLDVLGAVRVMHMGLGSLRRFEDFYPEMFKGCLSPGLEAGSEEESRVDADLAAVRIKFSPIEHELRPGYRRLPYMSLATLEAELGKSLDLSKEAFDTAMRVAREGYRLEEVLPELRDPFVERLNTRAKLRELGTWWNAIPTGVQVTGVGRVLASANAKRLDAAGVLPPLE